MLSYNPKLKTTARYLRKHLTDSEHTLWWRLRRRQLFGVQFLRQKPIGNYIVDFYAPTKRLVIEVDGSQHLESKAAERDESRDRFLGGLDLRVLRFSSREVLEETEAVMEVICRALAEPLGQEKSPLPPLFQRGE